MNNHDLIAKRGQQLRGLLYREQGPDLVKHKASQRADILAATPGER